MTTKDDVGRWGEDQAVAYLLSQGFEVVERNWRYAGPQLRGELDIIASDGDCLVVVEVKTRRSTRFGGATEAVTPVKVARLRRLAGVWVAQHPQRSFRGLRLDVVGVLAEHARSPHITHLRAVG